MLSKRLLLAGGFAAATATACHRDGAMRRPAGPLNVNKLTASFAPLAARATPARFGLGVQVLARDEVWLSDATGLFPMQSVFKAPLAAAALAEVDARRLKLDEAIKITDLDLSPPFSAIDQAWPTPPQHHAALMPAIDLIALDGQRDEVDGRHQGGVMLRRRRPRLVDGAEGRGQVEIGDLDRFVELEASGIDFRQGGGGQRRLEDALHGKQTRRVGEPDLVARQDLNAQAEPGRGGPRGQRGKARGELVDVERAGRPTHRAVTMAGRRGGG